jgi:hypothetical protein
MLNDSQKRVEILTVNTYRFWKHNKYQCDVYLSTYYSIPGESV